MLEDRTVSAVATVDLARELIDRNLLKESELKELSPAIHHCNECMLDGHDVTEERMSEADLVMLWELADQRKVSSSLGFDIGSVVNHRARGFLANWISYCDSLGDAFSVFSNNVGLLNSAECWTLSSDRDAVSLTFSFRSQLSYPTIAVERSMVALLAWGGYFSGAALAVESAQFAFSQPRHRDKYLRVFGPNLRFGCEHNRIQLNHKAFALPLSSANPYIRELLASRSSGLTLASRKALSLTTQVQSLLRHNLMKYSRLDNILTELNMSRTKLYRKLKAEGTQFSELLLQERLRVFEGLHRRVVSTEDRAQQMGFEDVSSYYRFLKRTNPSE
ncbi:MAG: AraC family transcriptional regulator ligand-binding domain-containing protein [Cellvibrionaceae bacterium]